MKSCRVLSYVGVACIGILVFATRISSQGNTGPNLEVINRTAFLQVFAIKKEGTELKLILRNNSNKNITAFSISLGSYGVTRDLSYNEHLLAPGASYNLEWTPKTRQPVKRQFRLGREEIWLVSLDGYSLGNLR